MQQLSRVCMIADHNQMLIEYVCIYPQCNLKRFACSKCVKIGNHKHQQNDQSHILDKKELYEVLLQKLNKRQSDQKFRAKALQRVIQGIHYLFKNMRNIINRIGQEIEYDNSKQIEELTLKLRNNGLNQFDDIQLKLLININTQDFGIYNYLSNQSNQIIKNATRIQELCYQGELEQKLINSNHNFITQDQADGDNQILSSAISNDFKFMVAGGTDKKLKIWNYGNSTLIKSIQLDRWINFIKFTDDSKLLYIGKYQDLYQFDVDNNFKETYKQAIHSEAIINLYIVTNTIILTSSRDKTIIKTDVNLKQQLLLIKAHDDRIDGLDYNHDVNMIATASNDKSIKLWNGNYGYLVLEKQNAHNNKFDFINQILFIIKQNLLMSLDNCNRIIIWNINYQTKQLQQYQQINDVSDIYNISLVLNQQYITLVCREYIKIYSIKGDYIRLFNHEVREFTMSNFIQPQSLKALIIQGRKTLLICRVELDVS